MIFGIYTVLKYGLKWYFIFNKMNNDLKWMWFQKDMIFWYIKWLKCGFERIWYFDILNEWNVVLKTYDILIY